MSDPDDWVKAFNPDDIAQIESKAKKILDSETTVYELSLFITQADATEVVRAASQMQTGNQEAWMLGMSVLMSLIATMTDALIHDGINPYEES